MTPDDHAAAVWGAPVDQPAGRLRHLWDGHVGAYPDTCPHDCWTCGGQGCRPNDPTE